MFQTVYLHMSIQENQESPMRNFAFATSMISGGAVGSDYFGDPWIGVIVGTIIGAFLTALLLDIYADPQGKIKKTMSEIGGLAGLILGIYVTVESDVNALFSVIFFTSIGAAAGQMAAAILSFAALVLLVVSKGPIGTFLREAFL